MFVAASDHGNLVTAQANIKEWERQGGIPKNRLGELKFLFDRAWPVIKSG
jgi:hypothetical protein